MTDFLYLEFASCQASRLAEGNLNLRQELPQDIRLIWWVEALKSCPAWVTDLKLFPVQRVYIAREWIHKDMYGTVRGEVWSISRSLVSWFITCLHARFNLIGIGPTLCPTLKFHLNLDNLSCCTFLECWDHLKVQWRGTVFTITLLWAFERLLGLLAVPLILCKQSALYTKRIICFCWEILYQRGPYIPNSIFKAEMLTLRSSS